MTKQKTFKDLYKDLEKTRKALEEQQQKQVELEQQLGPALDNEIIKIVRTKVKDDTKLFNLLQDIQNNKIEIVFKPVIDETPEIQTNLLGGDLNDNNE